MISTNVQAYIASRPPLGGHCSQQMRGVVHVLVKDEDFRRDLSVLFGARGIKVRYFLSGSSYLTYKRSEEPTCLLMSLRLPDMCALDLQSRLVHTDAPPIVFISDRDDIRSCVRAMKQGAVDVLTRAEIETHLLTAIDTSFGRDRAAYVDRKERSTLVRRWHTLTPRESEVFRYVVSGFLNKQAASDLRITENTFQVHRGRVMKKMGADSLAALVRMSVRLAERGEKSALDNSMLVARQ
jgi:FixJ family two-component response regulator